MIQSQLIDYIIAQKKAGVSRETIASALVGVGWQVADVEYTLKKAEGDASRPAGQPVAQASAMSSFSPKNDPARPVMENKPAASPSPAFLNPKPMSAAPMSSAAPAGSMKPSGTGSFPSMDVIGGITGPKTAASQPIRVADFVGTTSSAGSPTTTVGSSKFNPSMVSRPVSVSGGGAVAAGSGKKVVMIAEIVIIVALVGLSVFLYMQNAGLNAKISTLTTSPSGGSPQTSDLQNQIQTLTASQGTLQGQVNDLTTANNDLKAQLSFFAAPSGTSAATSGTVTGLLAAPGGVKGLYSVRTQYDAVVFVKNTSDPKVAAALKPLVNSSITLEGSYLPGSDSLTVLSVNGNLVNAPATASTTPAVVSTTTVTTVTTVTTSSTTVTTSTTP